jgi:hypothetical protein
LTAALKQGVLKPKIISSLYASYQNDLVIDTGMTIDKMIQFVGVVRDVAAASIRTYQIEATGRTISGNAVLIWNKDSPSMKAILDIFQGKAPLAGAPEQVFATTTTTSTLPHTTTTATSSVPPVITSVAPPSVTNAPGNTAPLSNAPKTAIVPDPNVEC